MPPLAQAVRYSPRGICQFAVITDQCCPPSYAVIRAKVVGKKLLRDRPFGTMRYTVKQMKVSKRPSKCLLDFEKMIIEVKVI